MMSPELIARQWEMLIGRLYGPLKFRFLMQPLAGVLLATRVAMRDVREGRPPYFFLPAFVNRARRRELFRLAWQDVGKVFLVACALDVIYELITYRWIYPTQAVLVAGTLAIVPYLLVRGPLTRILYRARREKIPKRAA